MNRLAILAALGAASLMLSGEGLAAPAMHSGAQSMSTSTARTAPTQTAGATQPTQTTTTTTTQRGPTKTGQPSQSCEDLGNRPGRSASAPGSAFNPDGHAGTVYAGEQPQNSRNTASVSQYDVACARPSH